MNTLNRIFDPENKLFRQLARLTDLVGLSLLWTLLCLPLLTAGMASSALYDTSVRFVRLQAPGSTYRRFGQDLRENWLPAGVATLFWLVLAWLMYNVYLVLVLMANQGNRLAGLLYFSFKILSLLVLAICLWFFLILSRYRHGFVSGHLLAVQMTFRHPLVSLVMAALVSQVARAVWIYWWPILFAPSLTTLILSLFVEKIWQKYDPENSPFKTLLNDIHEEMEAVEDAGAFVDEQNIPSLSFEDEANKPT